MQVAGNKYLIMDYVICLIVLHSKTFMGLTMCRKRKFVRFRVIVHLYLDALYT